MSKLNLGSEIEMKVSKARKMEMLEKMIGPFDTAKYESSASRNEFWKIIQNGKELKHNLIFSKRYQVWMDYDKFNEADINGSFSKKIAAARKKQWSADELALLGWKPDTLYIAYGSNLNKEQMAYRCPGATIYGSTALKDYRLVFRGMPGNTHATIEKSPGSSVPVLIWRIDSQHEASLDRYEGFPRYYYKEYFGIEIGKMIVPAMVYIMTPGKKRGAPSEHYYEAIKAGYEAAGFDTEILEKALEESCQ